MPVRKKTRDKMRNTIDAKRVRPKSSNNLNKHIETGYTDLPGGDVIVWVGDITDLDKYAPYWYIQNYGGKIKSGPVPGNFGNGPPVPGGGGSNFNYVGGGEHLGASLMNPMKPIKPKNYIEKAMIYARLAIALMKFK